EARTSPLSINRSVASVATTYPWYYNHDIMAHTEIERLSRLMLDEFKRVHKRLDEQQERFDHIDDTLASARAELKQLRTELENLKEKVPQYFRRPQNDCSHASAIGCDVRDFALMVHGHSIFG